MASEGPAPQRVQANTGNPGRHGVSGIFIRDAFRYELCSRNWGLWKEPWRPVDTLALTKRPPPFAIHASQGQGHPSGAAGLITALW